jgi:hypothetical protein
MCTLGTGPFRLGGYARGADVSAFALRSGCAACSCRRVASGPVAPNVTVVWLRNMRVAAVVVESLKPLWRGRRCYKHTLHYGKIR